MTILIPIIAIIILVIIHELGHFFAAKAVGVKVLEFAVGFPPRVVSFLKGGTKYSFGAILLGGFVKLKGDEIESIDLSKDSFSGVRAYKKIIILVAGVIMNFIAAWVIFTVLFTKGIGLPAESLSPSMVSGSAHQVPTLSIIETTVGSPADIADLPELTKMKTLQSENLTTPIVNPTREEFIAETKKGATLLMTFEGDQKIYSVTPEIFEGDVRVGVSLVEDIFIKKPIIESIPSAFGYTAFLTKETFSGFVTALHGIIIPEANKTGISSSAPVSGPIGIVKMLGTTLSEGYSLFLVLVAIISINLAVLNILPLPILDGGRVLIVLYESLRRKKLSKTAQTVISLIGIFLMLSLAVFGTINDLS